MIKNVYIRILLLPIMIINFILQLFIFSIFMGLGFGLGAGLIFLIMAVLSGEKIEKDIIFILTLGWIVGPFIWWYRYFKTGDYRILKEMRDGI